MAQIHFENVQGKNFIFHKNIKILVKNKTKLKKKRNLGKNPKRNKKNRNFVKNQKSKFGEKSKNKTRNLVKKKLKLKICPEIEIW